MVSSSVAASLTTVYQQLTAFAGLESFWTNFDSIFGTEYNIAVASSLRSQWQSGNFSLLPTIQVISDEILGNARGAYASSTNIIYLSDGFVATASPQALEAVLIEEIGHFVDAQVNGTDTAGDEGELFSAVVRGIGLSATELSRIKTEDDHAVVIIDGQATAIEQSTGTTVAVTVFADCNPWLAGMPNGSTAIYGDLAPDQSPILVSGLPIIANSILTFSAVGSLSNYPYTLNLTPDGNTNSFTSHSISQENGIGQIVAPFNSLVGIFLDSQAPNLTSINSKSLDFRNTGNVINGINYTVLAPQIKQPFFIGDGINNQGIRQQIIVPQGATRLFLGSLDAYEWQKNYGSVQVSISGDTGSGITFGNSTYSLTTATTWTDAEAQAVAMGGHLVAVNDAAENQFLVNTFGGSEYLWIGYTDAAVEGQWKWTSNETSTYTNWAAGEPSNYTGIDPAGEDYSFMNFISPGKWNDTNNTDYNKPYRGIIEVKNNTATLSINDVTITEGNSGTKSATFTITRTGTATNNITVNYSIANGTATAGSDYTATSGTLTFLPNETVKNITVPILGDTTVESDETFSINLTNPTNATISDAQGSGTITNDDTSNATNAVYEFLAKNITDKTWTIDSFINNPTLKVEFPNTYISIINLSNTLNVKAENLSVTYQNKPEPSFILQGSITLPDLYNAKADFSGSNYIKVKPTGLDVVGTLSVQNVPFGPAVKAWKIQNAALSFNTAQQTIDGQATVTIPPNIEVNGTFSIIQGKVNAVSLNAKGLNKPIGTTGVVLQDIAGAFNNIADLSNLEFTGGVKLTAGPEISLELPSWLGGKFSGSLLSLDLVSNLNKDRLNGHGNFQIINGFGKGTGNAELNWNKGILTGDLDITFANNLMSGNAKFNADSKLNVNFDINSTLNVPNAVPLIGGKSLGNSNLHFDYTNDNNNSNDYIRASSKITLADYYLKIPFLPDKHILIEEEASILAYFNGQGEVKVGSSLIRFGNSNIARATSPAVLNANSINNNVSIPQQATVVNTSGWDVAQGTPWIVLTAAWDNANNNVAVQVKTPDGKILNESDFAANNIIIVSTLSSSTRKAVIIQNPTQGFWDINVTNATGLGNVQYSAFRDSVAPTIAITNVTQNANLTDFTINYNAIDPDSQAKISLYYDTDKVGNNGVLITNSISEQDGSGSFKWNTSGLSTGTYYVYGMILDDNHSPVFKYASNSITISNNADLTVAQTVSSETVKVNQDVTYTIKITNNGPKTAKGVQLLETLPDTATFKAASLVPSQKNGKNLTFNINDLAPGASTNLTLVVTPTQAGYIYNRAEVTSQTYDSSYVNDLATSSVSVTPQEINFSVDYQTLVEGFNSPQTLSYTVTLSNSSTQTITVKYSTANGTALAGSDYTTKTGTLTFNPGVTTQTITIPILNNSINEANETFSLFLSNPTNAILGTKTLATTTITDTLSAATTTTLPTNVENLTLTGTLAINGVGNVGNNVIQGNSKANTLDGKIGADSLVGGLGNDTYIVDNVGDIVTETSTLSTEIDTIQSSVTYILGNNIENLVLTGTTTINGTGNTLKNTITGNGKANILDGKTGADSLVGGLGNDTYLVDNVGDIVTETSILATEIDTIQSSVTYTLGNNIENLVLTGTTAINGTGNILKNTITGNSKANILDGKTGADSLIGGLGNDTYIVDNVGDKVTETSTLATEIDTIQSSVTYTLGNNIENLILTGTTAINGTGNAGKNTLTGNSASNILKGGAGNDILIGAAGKDSLTGGLGIDRFSYKVLTDSLLGSANNSFDVITDFNANAGNDLFLVAAARTGLTTGLTLTGITSNFGTVLNTTNFAANAAARIDFVSGTTTRKFVAINDAIAGFNATTDAVVEITGLTGNLTLANFTTI